MTTKIVNIIVLIDTAILLFLLEILCIQNVYFSQRINITLFEQ